MYVVAALSTLKMEAAGSIEIHCVTYQRI